jgi:hypothetical protein
MLSFGIGGYNTSQEYLTLQKHVQLFSPDLVLLAMFLGNDIEGNSAQLQNADAWRMPSPTHTLINGELVLNDSFNDSVSRRLLYAMVHHSRVLELINEVRRLNRARAWRSSANDTEIGLSPEIYREPEALEWHEAWRITEVLLAKMNDLVRLMGARFVVTTIPSAIEVDPRRERREQFEARIGVDNLLYPDEQIARMGARASFPVYPLTRELQLLAEQREVYTHGFANTGLGRGHMNEEGHSLVAELLATKLCNSTDLGIDDQQIAEPR